MSHQCKQAVILAAGKGKRLGKHGEEKPKSLYEFNGKSLLERKVDIFNNEGFEDIIIVVGYKADMIIDAVKKYNNIKIVYNPFFYEYQSMQSLSLVYSHIDTCFVQTEADLTFDPKIIKELLKNSSNSMVHTQTKESSFTTVPHFSNGELVGYKRDIKYRSGIQQPPNFIGPSHFTKEMLLAMKNHNANNQLSLLYEEAVAIAVREEKLPLSILYQPDYKFWDLNTEEDFEKTQNVINMLDEEV